jgi:subtilisin-like proprotein convertase family protein
VIANSSPIVMPADTGWIDICLGETIFVQGMGLYPENGQTYNQSDATSAFQWSFGDGTTAFGPVANHTYDEPGAYFINLDITDTLGCTNDNVLQQRVRVHGISNPTNSQPTVTSVCADTPVTLTVEPIITANYTFGASSFSNTDTLAIPDGDGTQVSTVIQVNTFPQDAIFDNLNQLESICVNMEHSWMRDLIITLTAPNGASIILHEHPGQTGGQVFLGEPVDNDGGFPIWGVGYDYCWANAAPNPTWIQYSNANLPATLPADTYSTFDPISNLLGTPLNGTWTLTIADIWAADNGALFSWALLFDYDEIYNTAPETFEVSFDNGMWLPDNSITFSNEDSLVALPQATTTYTYQATDNFGCITNFDYEVTVLPANAPACQSCDSLMVTLLDSLVLSCTNNGINTLTPTIQSTTNDIDFQWFTADGTFADPMMLNNETVEITSAGTYILTTSIPASGCSEMDTIVVTDPNLPSADAGEDITLFCQIPNYYSLSGSTDGTDTTPFWTTPNGEITFAGNSFTPQIGEPGFYILNVMDNSSNCVVADTVEVFLHPVLIDSLIAVDADCNQTNGSATIFSTADSSDLIVNWSNGATGATLTDLAPNTYMITVTDGNCTQTAAAIIGESDECDVTIRGRVFEGNICHPDSANLDWEINFLTVRLEPLGLEISEPLADGSYEFVVPPGDYTIIVDDGPIAPNDTYVIVCPGDNMIPVSLPLEGSISENNDFYWVNTVNVNDFDEKISLLNISPNPTNAHFKINYDLPISMKTSLNIYTLSGKLAQPIFENRNQAAGEHFEDLTIDNLPNGVYLVRLETENGVFFEKIIKQ